MRVNAKPQESRESRESRETRANITKTEVQNMGQC